MPRDTEVTPDGYQALLGDLLEQIREAQARAALSVNQEAVTLYWRIGRAISTRQEAQGWGAQVIDRLAADLRRSFPQMKGFSRRNLHYMRAFADAYPDEQFVQGGVSPNRRKFRHPRSRLATIASRSINVPSLWKV